MISLRPLLSEQNGTELPILMSQSRLVPLLGSSERRFSEVKEAIRTRLIPYLRRVMSREHDLPSPRSQNTTNGQQNVGGGTIQSNGPGDIGCCPSCQLQLAVGIPCTERGWGCPRLSRYPKPRRRCLRSTH